MAGCALLVESSPGTGTTHPPHPALLRPSPCNPTSIRRQVLRLLYGSGTGSLSCLSFARAYFVVPLYQYMRKRETHHYLFVACFDAQTTLSPFFAIFAPLPTFAHFFRQDLLSGYSKLFPTRDSNLCTTLIAEIQQKLPKNVGHSS